MGQDGPANSKAEEEKRVRADQALLQDGALTILGRRHDPTSRSAALRQLNQVAQVRPKREFALSHQVKADVRASAGAEAVARAERAQYDARDADYIRDCLYLAQLARRLQSQAEADASDLQRLVTLFDWVMQHVQWRAEGRQFEAGPVVATRPFLTLMRGTGSTADRAWLLCELFRQANYASCLIEIPASKENPAPWWPSNPLLVGVVLGDEVYLFEPTLGTPVLAPKGEESQRSALPIATLAQLLSHPTLLNQFSTEDWKYPVESVRVEQLTLFACWRSEMSAPRIKQLENFLGGDRRANLTSALPGKQSALSKVSNQLTPRVWPVLEESLSHYDSLDEEQQRVLQGGNPLSIGGMTYPRQLLDGDTLKAMQGLVTLDMTWTLNDWRFWFENRRNPPANARLFATLAQQDVLYLVGLAKIGRTPPNWQGGLEWFTRYLAPYEDGRLRERDVFDWIVFCRNWLTPALAPPQSRPAYLKAAVRCQQLLSVEGRKAMKEALRDLSDIEKHRQKLADLRLQRQQLLDGQRTGGLLHDPTLVAQRERLDQQIHKASAKVQQDATIDTDIRKRILKGVNYALDQADLFRREDFPKDLPDTYAGKQLKKLLAVDAVLFDKAKLRRHNRQVMRLVFPNSLASGNLSWLPNAQRLAGRCEWALGQHQAAQKRLSADYGPLSPVQLASLRAVLRWWQKSSS